MSPIEVAGPCGIRLNHVDYRYDDAEREILKDLDFDFYPGSCTAILGETGAGKTTLVRMLLALMKPNKGSVEIYNEKRKQRVDTAHAYQFLSMSLKVTHFLVAQSVRTYYSVRSMQRKKR